MWISNNKKSILWVMIQILGVSVAETLKKKSSKNEKKGFGSIDAIILLPKHM